MKIASEYGSLPKNLGEFQVRCEEMMFYQYLPICMPQSVDCRMERRLDVFRELVGKICCDFIAEYGLTRFNKSYVYLTAKRQWVFPGHNMNREGWHSDGFLTDDINYIWSDCLPTVFAEGSFQITPDDKISMVEMEEQAKETVHHTYPANSILRLDQSCIHKCGDIDKGRMRTFVKVSFSYDKYDLIGNSHNYEFDYDWEMKPRGESRNIPQSQVLTA